MRPRIGLGGVGLDYHNGRAVEAEIRSDDVGLQFPLCGEDRAASGDRVHGAGRKQVFVVSCVASASKRKGACIFRTRKNRDAPALEGVAFTRGLGQGDSLAGEIEVVDLKEIVVGVVDSGHVLDIIAASLERYSCEVQVAGELIAFFVIRRIAGLHVLVYGLVQDSPCDLFSGILGNIGFECDALRQLCKGCGQLFVIAEV